MLMRKLFFSLVFIYPLFTLPVFGQPPVGYYNNAAGLTGEELKTSLHEIIIQGHNPIWYSEVWSSFLLTDIKSNGKVWDMYSDIPGNPPYEYEFIEDQCTEGSVPEEGICYNREHSWPRSWYGPAGNEIYPMHSDLFHVYPTDAFVNQMRSNYPFGVVANPDWVSENGSKVGLNSIPGYNGLAFEPIDEYKGDFARTYFYMVTRYEDLVESWQSESPMAAAILDGTSYPAFQEWYIDLLISWHEQDPVSEKEITRNNAVYNIQGNRNPFIDRPEFVNYIWGTGLSDEPENHVTGFSANTITLNWTDAAGPILPDGYLIRMSVEGFEQIEIPTDGIPVENDFWNRNVMYGEETVTFGGLTSSIIYYFKIFSYKRNGETIDYKTDGEIPRVKITAK
ncbi:MAG: hypothetical protein EA393_09160 [Bacteroidetes bacterium]|nr:MAG: hypothetical protein EA393_09160 [Bacteroidota bacterium]